MNGGQGTQSTAHMYNTFEGWIETMPCQVCKANAFPYVTHPFCNFVYCRNCEAGYRYLWALQLRAAAKAEERTKTLRARAECPPSAAWCCERGSSTWRIKHRQRLHGLHGRPRDGVACTPPELWREQCDKWWETFGGAWLHGRAELAADEIAVAEAAAAAATRALAQARSPEIDAVNDWKRWQ